MRGRIGSQERVGVGESLVVVSVPALSQEDFGLHLNFGLAASF